MSILLAALLFAGCSRGGDDTAAGRSALEATGQSTASPASTTPEPPVPSLPDDAALPMVFVHGFAGSAQQFESQAMRFVANGYSPERIITYDHDGSGMDLDAYTAGLAEVIDEALARFSVDQVYLVGHSRGTFVSADYLSVPEQASKVAKYVALDGRPCVDAVACVAITRATLPGQSHVEVATSRESFVAQYEFLLGETPQVVDLVAAPGSIEVSGRAVNFPLNTGRSGATLNVYELDPDTGHRSAATPLHSSVLGSDGAFGPIALKAGGRYEYELVSPDSEIVHHVYPQPHQRDSRWMRLLTSTPDGATRTNTNTSDDHTSLIAMRMREWYGDGERADRLTVSVDGGEPIDVITDFVANGAIGLHLHDDALTPGVSTLGPLAYFAAQPFQSGVDVFIPATPDGTGTVTVTNLPRGDTSRPQVVTVPRWPSSGHAISVVFSDWPIDAAA
ncbi:MAG: alpha/beta hydrolase [Actinobacteria bacterium]|nr:alpha/beta hydrolase [Actinomycetota bacterium]